MMQYSKGMIYVLYAFGEPEIKYNYWKKIVRNFIETKISFSIYCIMNKIYVALL